LFHGIDRIAASGGHAHDLCFRRLSLQHEDA
jgi:hypothetical protein